MLLLTNEKLVMAQVTNMWGLYLRMAIVSGCGAGWRGGGRANFLVALLKLNAQTKKYGGGRYQKHRGESWERCGGGMSK